MAHTNGTKIISLNIVMTYPVRWSKYNVLRDFLQNFYDSVGYQHWKDSFRFEYTDKTLSLWIDDITFSYEWLLHIGASTKTADSGHHAGYFGEGFKIASLCVVRDYNWEVTMQSDDWELSVITLDQSIDSQTVPMLAYETHHIPRESRSRLTLYPVKEKDFQLFQEVISSFYYYGNPLLGEKLREGEEGAVYLFSGTGYQESLPYTSDFGRKGPVFCGCQLLGSNPFGLAVCLHNYEKEDRERKSLYTFNVIRVFEKIAYYISPYGAMRVLEKMRRYWNSTPKKRIDIFSWNGAIERLIRRIAGSQEVTKAFLEPIFSIAARNRRGQARAWLSAQSKQYLLVQEAFSGLGYSSLEELCEQEGGFTVDDSANSQEAEGFALLEEIVQRIYTGFFLFDLGFPQRKIICNDMASYHGMARLYKRNKTAMNCKGIVIRYHVGEIYLKRMIFRENNFYDALATYVHEMCHAFGGDASNAFSKGLTYAMELWMERHDVVKEYREKWELLYK